jgi:hypothetical protein
MCSGSSKGATTVYVMFTLFYACHSLQANVFDKSTFLVHVVRWVKERHFFQDLVIAGLSRIFASAVDPFCKIPRKTVSPQASCLLAEDSILVKESRSV